MEKILRGALIALGCDDKEIKLYLAAYLHGTAPLSDLIVRTRLRRSTAYLVTKSLLDKGLLIEDHKAYGKSLSAAEPEILMRLVANRQRQLGRQRIELEENLGQLQAMHQTSVVRPRVRTFQGANGLLSVWRDILTAQSGLLLWTNQATEVKLFSLAQHNQFIRERCERNLQIRVLAVHNMAGQRLQDTDHELLRSTRLLSPGLEFSAETYLYDHKIAMLDYNQDIIGIIIESEQLSSAQRAMFESSWAASPYVS